MVLNGLNIPHRHAVDRPQLLSDGEDVQQRLGWMLPHAISSIYHRLTAMTRCTLNATEGDELHKDKNTENRPVMEIKAM